MSAVKYCRCAFTDTDGTVARGDACELHPGADRDVPRDRRESALGNFLRTPDGADAFRDSCGNDLIARIGELAICGDDAAIGRMVIDYMLADAGMQSSMKYAEAQERRQIRMELAEADRSSRIASQLGGDIAYVLGALR